MLSKKELLRRLNEVSDNTSAEDARNLFDDLSDYLNDAYDGSQPWDDDTGDVTPEYAAWEKKALEDLGIDESIFDTLNALQEAGDNPVTSETIIDKDDDGDADVTVIKQDDGDDNDGESSDKPHDEGLAGETTPEEEAMLALASGESKPSTELAGDTTLEEDLMLNPDMSSSEFSKKAAEKRGAKPGEPAPDFNNFTNDIARNLASRRW